MQKVTEQVKEKVRYTATIYLTNSGKVGFTRRDLAQSFYPLKVVTKADRVWETLIVPGTRTHEDNPILINFLWNNLPKSLIYDGTVKKEVKRTFDWIKIAKKIYRDYNVEKFQIFPERRSAADALVEKIVLTSNTDNYNEHLITVKTIIDAIKHRNPQLTWTLGACKRSTDDGKCPVVTSNV